MIIGTRGSKLALVQTNYIKKCLFNITKEKIDINIIKTTGDKITDSQLYNIDSKGLFTKELDKAVLEEEVDFAIHSLKDVPTDLDENLEIAAVPVRESPNEVFVSKYKWDELPKMSSLGTSSLRREAFCNHHNKKLKLKPIRGNIETRVNKVINGEVDATIMAEAGLKRLNLTHHIQCVFSLEFFTPPAGQGALAIITRKDSLSKEIIQKINHYNSFQEVLAEKAVLEELGVGCQWPVGSVAKVKNKKLELYSILLNQKGEILYKTRIEGSIKEAYNLGKEIGSLMEDYV
ncbi:MAG: hydroxymethylbilane synthase [Methanobacteriaceae archaeon]|nr:hydroxymethylbilane synthase [Candidatus Methanorudis spinitermitis]